MHSREGGGGRGSTKPKVHSSACSRGVGSRVCDKAGLLSTAFSLEKTCLKAQDRKQNGGLCVKCLPPLCSASTTGHGEHGDVVSNFVMHELQACLAAHPSLLDDPAKALMESYVKVDESLAASKASQANHGTERNGPGEARGSVVIERRVGDESRQTERTRRRLLAVCFIVPPNERC